MYTVWMVIYLNSNVNILIFWDTDFWLSLALSSNCSQQPYHPAAQDWLPTEAKQGWACGQYLDGRSPGKTRFLLEEVLVRPAGSAHPVVCVGPNTPV